MKQVLILLLAMPLLVSNPSHLSAGHTTDDDNLAELASKGLSSLLGKR